MTPNQEVIIVIDVTPNDNLVTCERPAWPDHRPFIDLTTNLNLARKIINTAFYFFLFGTGVKYSGYARQVTAQDGEMPFEDDVFYVQVWEGERLHRTVGYRHFGYVGTLHAEIKEGQLRAEIDRDYIGDACKGIEANISLPINYASKCIAYVEGDLVQISFPHNGN